MCILVPLVNVPWFDFVTSLDAPHRFYALEHSHCQLACNFLLV
ncbi:unnamed protein product [Ectocarpus sp. CCAP 1310/34]|nr:unnamed protein product [Ectocarpus sp. CCAP 1310/34]